MANLDDLNYKSILNMSDDESLELIRQTRLRRRTLVKQAKEKPTSQPTKSKKPPKSFDVGQLSEDDKAELLKLLMGE